MDFKDIIETKASIKSALKKGRKAGLSFGGLSLGGSKNEAKESKSSKLGGWAEESAKLARRPSSFPEEPKFDDKVEDLDDIPVIPTLEDYGDNIPHDVATAPIVTREVASYNELENDLLQHSVFASMEDVNLLVLTRFLRNKSNLVEPDEPWTREGLFAEIKTQQRTN